MCNNKNNKSHLALARVIPFYSGLDAWRNAKRGLNYKKKMGLSPAEASGFRRGRRLERLGRRLAHDCVQLVRKIQYIICIKNDN